MFGLKTYRSFSLASHLVIVVMCHAPPLAKSDSGACVMFSVLVGLTVLHACLPKLGNVQTCFGCIV